MTALDEAVLRNMGDEAVGIAHRRAGTRPSSTTRSNRQFVAEFRAAGKYDPGFYAGGDVHRRGSCSRRR